MGGAISAMHYTGMAAASFIPSAEPPNVSRAVSISSLGTLGIAAVTLVVLGFAVLSSIVARRFSAQEERLRALTIQLSRTEERERKRLAIELHDNLAQVLALAKMKGEAIQRSHNPVKAWTELEGILDEALTYTRNLMAELRPPLLGDEQDLRRAVEWVTEKLQRHGLRVSIQDDGTPKILEEDVLTVTYQALHELLINVVKHAQTQTATISLAGNGDYLEAAVKDEGVGFAVTNLQATSSHGFGLLSIRERVESLGGRLEIASSLNRGTCAKIVVPLKARPEARLSIDERRTASLTSEGRIGRAGQKVGRKIRVMLVDDHRLMREGLRHIFEGETDMEVVGEAEDGRMAIELIRMLRPDVVIMDINMPWMNGVDATRQITREFPDVVVIGLSMHEDERMIDTMRQAGAVAYLSKSDAFEALCKTIRDSLRD